MAQLKAAMQNSADWNSVCLSEESECAHCPRRTQSIIMNPYRQDSLGAEIFEALLQCFEFLIHSYRLFITIVVNLETFLETS